MRWPWQPQRTGDMLAVSWSEDALAYVLARSNGSLHEVKRLGVEHRGADSAADFARRLEGMGLGGAYASVMLRPRQYQWLQIEAPGVAPEELRSAARYQIRDMLDVHVDDVTLDVMRVGDGQQKSAANLFVIAARNSVVRGAVDFAAALRWDMQIIDVQETAQRNLQNVLAADSEGAHAALVLVDAVQAVLTICARGEIFYTRRLEIPEGFLDGRWDNAHAEVAQAIDAFAPVEEYVPGHAGDMADTTAFGAEYVPAAAGAVGGREAASAPDAVERAQRFLVEVQRSLDLWDRAWSSMPLAHVRVYAGPRSGELARWLTRELGQSVSTLQVEEHFPGFTGDASVLTQCWPLLGMFLRTEQRKP